MKVSRVIFSEDSFGITERSLRILRDAIVRGYDHKIVVFRIETNDPCCGYFIFDIEVGTATWTGDGFRMDGGGEGGAGYKSADALFHLFGIYPFVWDIDRIDVTQFCESSVNASRDQAIATNLRRLAQKIADVVTDAESMIPVERKPQYVRGL